MNALRSARCLALAAIASWAPTTTTFAQREPVNGMRPADLRAHALVDATVVVAPGQVLEHATIVIRDGIIEAVGEELEPPKDARVRSAAGLRVYPGLIDPAVLVEVEKEPESLGDHWNPRVHPQISLAARAVPEASRRSALRSSGFTAAAVYPKDGIFRGSGIVVALADEPEHVLAYLERGPMGMGFDYGGGWSNATYPGSLMGAMALIRQTIRDVRWHEQCLTVYAEFPEGNEPPIRADALIALQDVAARRQPVCFEVDSEYDALRAAGLARELGLDVMLLGSGREFCRLDEVTAQDVPLIIPLDYPERPAIDSLATAERVTLREMMIWEQAPTNPRRLVDAGATVALTTHRLKKTSDFLPRLEQAIKHGLSEDAALATLTTTPAEMLGLDEVMGTIEPGKVANLVVVDGSLFEKKGKIRDVWVNGRRYEISKEPEIKMVSSGLLKTDLGSEYRVKIDTTKGSLVLHRGDERLKAKKMLVQQDQVSFLISGEPFDASGFVLFSGAITDGVLSGTGMLPDGQRFGFTLETVEDDEDAGEDEGDEQVVAAGVTSDKVDTPSESIDGDVVTGRWEISLSLEESDEPVPGSLTLELGPDGVVTGVGDALESSVQLNDGRYDPVTGRLQFAFDLGTGTPSRLEAKIDRDLIDGTVSGDTIAGTFSGSRVGSGGAQTAAAEDDATDLPPEELDLPIGAYGLLAPPQPQDVLIENATIWTCGPQQIVENGFLLVRNGKVVSVSTEAPEHVDAIRIDATGKHVTPGLIDCHSHTGIDGGVNEWTQANTAEVRIGDSINVDDIDWYRQLAGGLIAANQLHGSANPIGGQNSVVKIRWGGTVEDFRIPDAIGGIKFALGENVKRSTNRYPNTRMGVETFIRDAFTAALAHEAELERYEALPTEERTRTMPPAPDLELDALVEVLNGDRIVHCHSYRQDEILMLIRVADDFGFTIGTFQHVLEGYKVADAIARHGAGGSSFSDWWAYKMEVMDAIPYNGALMTQVGVVTSFNSDSDELARRMNTEAAKAVRYGGLDRQEAFKLVTLNPARQLRIDHRTGSLEVGKDADFVIWSEDPLSTYARCEQTWIEGACYFSLDRDRELRERDAKERQRLIQKVLTSANGKPDKPDKPEKDDAPSAKETPPTPTVGGRLLSRMLDERLAWMEEQVRLGNDPDEIRPGRCACNDTWWLWMTGGGE